LKINIRFSAHLLRPNVEIFYDKKFKTVGDTKATDIAETLKEWMPEGEEQQRLVYWLFKKWLIADHSLV